MIIVKSLNAASYITSTTGEVANVIIDENGADCFEFTSERKIKMALNGYRNATSNKKELNVDVVKFIENIKYYRSSKRTLLTS